MRNVSLIIIALFFCASCQVSNEGEKPNIILFLVDDMGWQDTSVQFHSEETAYNRLYQTPSMDRLAQQGLKFTQAYSTSVCTPTRVSLMTGMNAARHRVTNWTLREGGSHEPRHPELTHNLWNVNGLSMDSTTERAVIANTLPQILQENGYKTIHIGKAHFGAIGTSGADPLNLGFDLNVAGHAAGAPGSYFGESNFSNNRPNNVWAVPGLEKYHGEDIFLTEALTREAISLLDDAILEESPFFLYMSHYAVHTPIMADPRFFDKYLASGIDSTEAAYASMVEGMDKSLGDLLDWIEENKLDNTIVVFTSDNGGLSAVQRGGEKHTHNKPLSSGKGSAREGGIREPMIVSWPGITKAGTETSTQVIIEDFFPTILEMAGIKSAKTKQVIDGVSFTNTLRGNRSDDSRPLFWHYPNFWGPSGPGIGPYSTIRKGDWKLIYYHTDQNFELFNLEEDLGESINRYEESRSIADSLAQELGTYLRSVNADMPFDSTKMSFVSWPDKLAK